MAVYDITGGTALAGSVRLSGAKNLASKLILASLLPSGTSVVHNAPEIGETDIALDLIGAAGARIDRRPDGIRIDASTLHAPDFTGQAAKSRLSILLLGPLLYRFGTAHVPPVTGDQIGRRPVGFHIDALEALGATIVQTDQGFAARTDGLHGADIHLPYPSVGATETILLTASWASGITVATGVAVEPEVVALADFLRAMGADIAFDTDGRQLRIRGVDRFTPAEHTVLPDRLEAVSYASLALATDGSILIENAVAEHLTRYLDFAQQIGARVTQDAAGIRFERGGPLTPADIETGVHPGFMADWQQPSVVVLLAANGISRVHETVYEDRLRYTEDLRAMGGRIEVSTECFGTPCRFAKLGCRHSAAVTGPATLRPTTLSIPDIRAGMAHVVAALMAKGTSRLTGIEHLDRGYGAAQFQRNLRALGATIVRLEA